MKNRKVSYIFLCLKCYVSIASFQALLKEKEKFVQNSIAQLIGIIIKYESIDRWDDLKDFIRISIDSKDLRMKEVSKS